MRGDPPDLKTQIAQRIQATPDAVWTPVDFLDLGSREAVDKTLQRLTLASLIRRLERGLYDRPRRNRLTGQMSVPDYRRVIEAVARRDQTRMLVDGMQKAEMRIALQAEQCGPKMTRVVRHEIDAGIARLKPARQQIDREQKAVHLGKQSHDEGAERAKRCF